MSAAPEVAVQDLLLPRLGETMEEGTVVTWLKGDGDTFRRGEIIAEVETDKTIVEMPALHDGTLVRIIAPAGTRLAVGQPMAAVTGAPVAAAPGPAHPPAQAVPADRASGTAAPPVTTSGRVLASPNARRVAREMAVDLATVVQTGRRGRRTALDVARAATATAARPRQATAELDPSTGLALQHWPARQRTSARPWLLIHGLFGNCASWNGIAAALNDSGADVYAVDLPGHGLSTATLAEPAAVAAAIKATLRARHAGAVAVAGISMGAVFAAELARIDDDVHSLRLLCPAGLGVEVNRDFVGLMLAVGNGADIRPALAMLGPAATRLGQKAIDRMEAELRQRATEMGVLARSWTGATGQRAMLLPALREATAPARALFAVDDQVVAWQDAALLPDHVGAHFLADAGHMAHLDRPDRVLAFLAAGD